MSLTLTHRSLTSRMARRAVGRAPQANPGAWPAASTDAAPVVPRSAVPQVDPATDDASCDVTASKSVGARLQVAAPDDTAPDDTAPDDAAPDLTAPRDAAPYDAAAHVAAPDGAAPDTDASTDTATESTAPSGPPARPQGDAGMATAEYAIATVAAAGFAGLLVVILRSGEVRELLLGIIRSALSL